MEMGLAGEPCDEDDDDIESEARDATTLQARELVKMLINDLSVVQKIAHYTSS